MKRQALGRGLDALLPPPMAPITSLIDLELEQIRPNSLQPRLRFEPQKLEELAASIAENGVLQPIVVRQNGAGYEIVAGERRWRAAQKAGLERIPALIQDVSDEKLLALALVENIQRDDLSPIEEAHAYQLLMEQFQLTQQEISRRVGRSRTAVTNTLRLLRLPRSIQEAVINQQLSMGHARALIPLGADQQTALAQQIIQQGLSVREVEWRVKRLQAPPKTQPATKDANLRAAERSLEERWKTRVEIRQRGTKGQVVLHFHSAEELDRLYEGLLS
jgi:ParB family chromosome partitioning protein